MQYSYLAILLFYASTQITASTTNGSGPATSNVLIIPQGSNVICRILCVQYYIKWEYYYDNCFQKSDEYGTKF